MPTREPWSPRRRTTELKLRAALHRAAVLDLAMRRREGVSLHFVDLRDVHQLMAGTAGRVTGTGPRQPTSGAPVSSSASAHSRSCSSRS